MGRREKMLRFRTTSPLCTLSFVFAAIPYIMRERAAATMPYASPGLKEARRSTTTMRSQSHSSADRSLTIMDASGQLWAPTQAVIYMVIAFYGAFDFIGISFRF